MIDQDQNSINKGMVAAAVPTTETVSSVLPSVCYWDSKEAKKLFGAQAGDLNVLSTLNRKINKLKACNQSCEGYKGIISGGDPHDACTQHQIYEIRQRCSLLCLAYIFASEQMDKGNTTWESCCRQSCSRLNSCGIQQISDWNVLQRWNIAFRSTESFKHPNLHVALGKAPDPLFSKHSLI